LQALSLSLKISNTLRFHPPPLLKRSILMWYPVVVSLIKF
jgi:hypothetical protein